MRELLGVGGWGIISIGGISCKMTRGNFRWTWGCALRIGKVIVGVRDFFKKLRDLSSNIC